MRKRKRSIWAAAGALFTVLILWIAWGNTALVIHEVTIASERLPEAFSGLRIVQISDLHNAEFGEDNEKLLRMLEEAEPDIIVITGDLIDSRYTDTETALTFSVKAAELAPTYYVTGNHEARVPDDFYKLEREMKERGIRVLHGESEHIKKDGAAIRLAGIDDLSFYAREYPYEEGETLILQELETLRENDMYTVLLSHRPELFDTYVSSGVDLVFSGHAHGGQLRLPFAGGIFAPGQGFFPDYDAGLYTEGRTSMIVSRGIGNSIIPFRVNNRPEIIAVDLSR